MNRSALSNGPDEEEKRPAGRIMNPPLLYRAALQGIFGKRTEFDHGSITDALFVYLDVSTKEAHRGKKLASACIARMLRDCMERRIIVHWDAQNDVSRHLAEKFGFETETPYSVRRLPSSDHQESGRLTIGTAVPAAGSDLSGTPGGR